MDTKLLIIFVVLNIINVVVQTVKSIATVKCDKAIAAIVNAVAYGLYTVVTVYMLCELPLAWKAFIVAMCNLVGVYVVKFFEEKARKDKLWKVEVAIPSNWNAQDIKKRIALCGVSCHYNEVGSWNIFNCYCGTQAQTKAVVEIAKEYGGKMSAYESKTL